MDLRREFMKSVNNYGDKVAYSYMGKERTYAQLAADIEYCAGAFEWRGIGQGDKVALLLPNCEEFLISYYAIIGLGATVVPINPTYKPQEIAYILTDAQVKGVVAMGQIAEGFVKMAEQEPAISKLLILTTHSPVAGLESVSDLLTEQKIPTHWPELKDDDVAVLLYTSGTTGRPKGAMLTHKNMISNARSTGEHIEFSAEDVIICVLPMFHVFCMTVCMNMSVLFGSRMIILPRFSPQETIETIKKQQITFFVGVPTMYTMMLNTPGAQKEDFQSLKFGISGGSALPVEIWEQFQKKYAIKIIEGYGLSEASPVCSFNPLTKQKSGSIGQEIPDVTVKIFNDQGEELPNGQIGELVVQGPNVMLGYYNNPTATAEAIKEGWLYTGDLATMDNEGYLYIVDRKKDMILVGGYNVYPREVEEVIYRLPEVEEVAVVGVPSEIYGEKVKAFIKFKTGQSLSEEAIIEFCTQNMAKYKVPKEIIYLPELPKNSTGKILRRLLKDV